MDEYLLFFEEEHDQPCQRFAHYKYATFYRASYASTVLAVIVCLSVRLSVRLSVCLSQVGVVQRWLNLGSH